MNTPIDNLSVIRQRVRQHLYADEAILVRQLAEQAALSPSERKAICDDAAGLIARVRDSGAASMMEAFLAEYGLSTKEGVALMCLAEALLRVPDAATIDALIEDKITAGQWQEHLGHASSPLINAATWGLLITGKLLSPSEERHLGGTLRGMIKRMGEPLVRTAVAQVMREMGRQFVLGTNMDKALKRAEKMQAVGYTYSYDMLGEAAKTNDDALRYMKAYQDAISALAPHCHGDVRENPGISVKLSALFPRYEFAQRDRVLEELLPRVHKLADMAARANMGFNIDAEEADRLDVSLDVIETLVKGAHWGDWQGFGVVVQAYGKRASFVLDWLYQLASQQQCKMMVRLVKGAYWDSEIKRAQVLGTPDYPVFTRKVNSDVSYLACARQLFAMTDRIYPQFATHNAHTVAAVMHMAGDQTNYEFQRLHGMGESLYRSLVANGQVQCRIYAPVGAHSDLLAYLVRRLLENGANSSFVHQLVDSSLTPQMIASDPFVGVLDGGRSLSSLQIPAPKDIFGTERRNAKGWDLTDPQLLDELYQKRQRFAKHHWYAGPLVASNLVGGKVNEVINPSDLQDVVGYVTDSTLEDVDLALAESLKGRELWHGMPVADKVAAFRRYAKALEDNADELMALACREAGKTLADAVAELREAVDFALYYANQIDSSRGRGTICCISPWNFPLAIFAGQCLGALAAGNAVVAKPAEQTPLMAFRAVQLMHEAGIPVASMQLLTGRGSDIGHALTSDARVSGVCFTGSTPTAQRINRNMANHLSPNAPLIAETGGLNAMIVDSTALPEQVVRDVVASAFQSAGQRCSALRVLYVQKDIADKLLEMLYGAMDELVVGNPWYLSTDLGPVIDGFAKDRIKKHIDHFAEQGRLLKQLEEPTDGTFIAPTVLAVNSIAELGEEIFGPVLHVALFESSELEQVISDINSCGYGLTFGLHTRLDHRVRDISQKIMVGNTYVNRNQIGAVVGSQPFGGEGLSGTGPKAGGPLYVARMRGTEVLHEQEFGADCIALDQLQAAIDSLIDARHMAHDEAELSAEAIALPGPTGELNLYSRHPRGLVICLGPSAAAATLQLETALAAGNSVVCVVEAFNPQLMAMAEASDRVRILVGQLQPDALRLAMGFHAVAWQGSTLLGREYRKALAERGGALIPLIAEADQQERFQLERHLCIDTTAAGGNASLIAIAE